MGVYGLDLMLDTDYHMWLIEVNMSPCLAHSTDVTADLVPRFQEDLAKIIADPDGSDTGDLELILKKPLIKGSKEHLNTD